MLAAAKRHWSLLRAARFVARWEGYLKRPYLDEIASPPVWTAGYGHTDYAGAPKVVPGQRWSRPKALRVLAHDCRGAVASVNRNVRHRITVRQRIALASFCFNLGPNILPGTELVRCVNEGRWHRAAQLMLDYDHGGNGEVVEGLLRRRRAEAWLMTHPRAKDRQPVKPRRGDTRAERLRAG